MRLEDNVIHDKNEVLCMDYLCHNIPGGIMGGYFEDKFPVYLISEDLLHYLGYSKKQEFITAVDGYIINCIHPEDRDYVENEIRSKLSRGAEYQIEYRMQKKNGNYIWIAGKGKLVSEENGRAVIISVCLDVSENKKKEIKLNAAIEQLKIINEEAFEEKKRAEQRYKEELMYREAMQDKAISTAKLELIGNRIVNGQSKSNLVMHAFLCGTVDSYLNDVADSILKSDKAMEFRERFNRLALIESHKAGNCNLEMEFTRNFDTKRQHWIRYSVHMIKQPYDDEIVAFIYAVDISEEKLNDTIVNTILKEDYEYLVAVDGMNNLATSFRKASYMDDMYKFDESNYDEVCEKQIRQFVAPEDVEATLEAIRLERVLEELEKQDIYQISFNSINADGIRRKKCTKYVWIDKEAKNFLMARMDVQRIYEEEEDKKQQLDRALLEAEQASMAKTDFLAKMSHELRTPMNAIIGLEKMAVEELPEGSIAREYMDKSAKTSRYLLTLLNDMLDLTRVEKRQLSIINDVFYYDKLIENVCTMIEMNANKKGQHFRVKKNGISHQAYIGDQARIEQILINVLNNAMKFTDENGSIYFGIDLLKLDEEQSEIHFIIEDNGIGMSKEFQERMYDYFAQENDGITIKYGGSGLGLTIAKNLVELMGGRIEAESTLGKGTRFMIALPLQETGDLGGQEAESFDWDLEQIDFTGRKGLIVEDHRLNRIILENILNKKNMDVDYAENGAEAIKKVAESSEGTYDMIFMDIRMPVMDGLTSARRIRKLNRKDVKRIPIVAVSANAYEEDVAKSISAGMNAHLSKPVEPEKVYEVIYSLLH